MLHSFWSQSVSNTDLCCVMGDQVMVESLINQYRNIKQTKPVNLTQLNQYIVKTTPLVQTNSNLSCSSAIDEFIDTDWNHSQHITHQSTRNTINSRLPSPHTGRLYNKHRALNKFGQTDKYSSIDNRHSELWIDRGNPTSSRKLLRTQIIQQHTASQVFNDQTNHSNNKYKHNPMKQYRAVLETTHSRLFG